MAGSYRSRIVPRPSATCGTPAGRPATSGASCCRGSASRCGSTRRPGRRFCTTRGPRSIPRGCRAVRSPGCPDYIMQTRQLGPLTVSALGLGCMGMSEFYGPTDEAEGIATIHRALDLGVTLLDTADVYGPHTNEVLVGKAVKGRRDGVVIATKFGIVRDPNDPLRRGISGKPDYVRASCEASLKRLGVETIDLYYQHRIDRSTPIEDTVGEMARLVDEGKIRYLGLSEASPATLERACKVHPIAALQTEFSLFYREPETDILPACRRLGVGFVGYSPLGRGLLGGTIRKAGDLTPDDWRLQTSRYQ